MNYNKNILLSLLCFVSVSLNAHDESKNKYRDELKTFKKDPSYELMFDSKRRNPLLQTLQRDIENTKKLSWSERMFSFLHHDSFVVTKENMPKLYFYIEDVCKKHDLKIPVIAISRTKGIFNAFAAKFFVTAGGILIGQDLLLECSEEEIEAVIAHELGHIKHNHVNKYLLLHGAVVAGAAMLTHTVPAELKLGIFIAACVSLPQLIIGKRFENQADEFAFKAGKAKGIAKFFARLEKEEQRNDDDFVVISEQLSNSKFQSTDDYLNLNLRYYVAKIGHKIGKVWSWLYHKTRLGAHPDNKERIKKAEEYVAAQG